MKVLTLNEPFATLIMNKKKYIETRSWKTNYRGELYIHAGKKKIDKKIYEREELIKLINNDEMHNSKIICKCDLVDCIYMTDEYIQYIKDNEYQQFVCGEYKVGRYAWILDNIELIDPIVAKGQLGIWNYNK